MFIGRYAFGGSLNCLWCHVFLGGVNRHVVTWDARKTTSRLRWKGKRRKWRHGFNGAKAGNYRLHLYRLAKVCKGRRLGLVYSTFTQTVVERHTLSSSRPQQMSCSVSLRLRPTIAYTPRNLFRFNIHKREKIGNSLCDCFQFNSGLRALKRGSAKSFFVNLRSRPSTVMKLILF